MAEVRSNAIPALLFYYFAHSGIKAFCPNQAAKLHSVQSVFTPRKGGIDQYVEGWFSSGNEDQNTFRTVRGSMFSGRCSWKFRYSGMCLLASSSDVSEDCSAYMLGVKQPLEEDGLYYVCSRV
jgi:hypothetical protein